MGALYILGVLFGVELLFFGAAEIGWSLRWRRQDKNDLPLTAAPMAA